MIRFLFEYKSRYIIFLFFLLFISLTTVKAQQKVVDSLLKALETASADTNKINILNSLAYETFGAAPSAAKNYADRALKLSRKIHYTKGEANAHHLIAIAYSAQNNFVLALNYELNAIRTAEKLNDFELIARCYNSMGIYYSSLSDFRNATDAFQKSLKAINKAKNKEFLNAIIHNTALLDVELKQYDKGLANFFKAADINLKTGNQQWLQQNYYEIAVVYKRLKKYDTAITYAEKSLAISQKLEYVQPEVNCLRLLGTIYRDLENYKKANQYLQLGLKKAVSKNLQKEQMVLFHILSDLFEKEGKYKEALSYVRRHDSIHKVFYNEGSEKVVAQNFAKIEARQRNLEDNLTRKEQLLKDAEIKRSNQLLYGAVAALVALIIFLIILFIKNKDIKEKNRLQQLQYIEIQQQKEKVEELNNIKDKLFSVIAHDLRSPFASFKSMVDLYDEDILSKEDTDFFFKQISKEASHINTLLDNLLIWAKSQMDGFSLNIKPVSIKKVFNEILYLQRGGIANKNITINNALTAEYFVNADYEMTKVIVRNLISNAIKFTPEGGSISLSSRKKDNMLEIAVSDTGIGMSEDQKQYLFRGDFYTTKGLKNEKGTGIGLQISKEFIEKQQGSIRVESEEQKGSTFYFTLPIGVNEGVFSEQELMSEIRDQDFLLDAINKINLESPESQDQYTLLAKVTNGTVYDLDIKNDKITWNKGLFSNFGYSHQNTDLNWWSSCIHPHDIETTEESLNAALENKLTTWRYEYRFRCSDGKYKYVQDRALILLDEKGEPSRMIGVMEDIQDRKDASAEMLRLSLVARNVTNLVTITDYEDRIVWVNKAFEAHTGYELNEIIGKKPKDFLGGPQTDKSLLNVLDDSVRRHEPISAEILNYTKEGKPYWAYINCTPYYDPLFNNKGFVTIQTVITDRKEKEQLILNKNEALREIARISSHEVRSPLSSILGLITLLKEASNQSEFEECLKLLTESSRQLDAVIYKIHHHISKLEAANS